MTGVVYRVSSWLTSVGVFGLKKQRFVHPIPDGPIVRVCLDGLRTAVVGYPEALLRHFRKRFNVR